MLWKTLFRLSRTHLDLYKFILSDAKKFWSVQSKTLQALDAVKNENHTLQKELQAARVHHAN